MGPIRCAVGLSLEGSRRSSAGGDPTLRTSASAPFHIRDITPETVTVDSLIATDARVTQKMPKRLAAPRPVAPSDRSGQISRTCVPILAISNSSSMFSLYSPMQPFDDLRPILRVSCVPWIRK